MTESAHRLPLNTQYLSAPIIRTKLYVPSVPLDYVRRDRLLGILDKAFELPLTLVSAPAGYGKSVLVSSWVRIRERPVAWFSLDETDSDLLQFLLHLLEAVDGTYHSSETKIKDLLVAHEMAPVPVLVGYLLNYLNAIDGPSVMVLDDYHHLDRQSEVHVLIGLVLEHLPPDCHLFILTRRDPPLPLTALRAGARLAEIRLTELQFTATETATLLATTAGLTINEATMDNLQRELEGWAAGLRLVVLAIHRAVDPEAFLASLNGGIPRTQEYLLNEVLVGLSPAHRDTLLKSSILDRYCAELIDVVCAGDDQSAPSMPTGQAFIDLLQHSNLFSFELDPDGRWYRYHHLFQVLLQRELQRTFTADDIVQLHLRASAWLEINGEIEESVKHALTGWGEELAADIVERHRRAALEQDQWITVQRWLDLLPTDLVLRRPSLLMAHAWVAHHLLNGAEIASCVEQLEAIVDDTSADPLVLAELNYFRSFLAYWAGDGARARYCSEQAFGVFPKDTGMMAGEIVLYLVLSRQMSGDSEAASELLKAEKALSSARIGDFYQTRLYGAEAFFNILAGRLQLAGTAAEQLDSIARRCESLYAQAWSGYLVGLTYCQSNRLEEARRLFELTAEHRNVVDPKTAIDTQVGLALTSALMQRPDDAMRTVEEMDEFSQALRETEFILVAESCRARVALLLGDQENALRWARSVSLVADPASLFVWLDEPPLTQARVRIVAGDEAERREALESLDELRRQLEALHNIGQTIEVDVLRSVALSKLGRTGEACDVLRTTVALATPGGWIRPFIEMGQPMAELLALLDCKGVVQDFVDRALKSIEAGVYPASAPEMPVAAQLFPNAGNAQTAAVRTAPMLNNLTNRELDVLELLVRRLQNKEIASRLFISTHTVNYHLKHIYQKLGVNNRRQAVAVAVEMELLPPS